MKAGKKQKIFHLGLLNRRRTENKPPHTNIDKRQPDTDSRRAISASRLQPHLSSLQLSARLGAAQGEGEKLISRP